MSGESLYDRGEQHRTYIREWLQAEEPTSTLVIMRGVQRVGKSTWLTEMGAMAEEFGVAVIWLTSESPPRSPREGPTGALRDPGSDRLLMCVDDVDQFPTPEIWWPPAFGDRPVLCLCTSRRPQPVSRFSFIQPDWIVNEWILGPRTVTQLQAWLEQAADWLLDPAVTKPEGLAALAFLQTANFESLTALCSQSFTMSHYWDLARHEWVQVQPMGLSLIPPADVLLRQLVRSHMPERAEEWTRKASHAPPATHDQPHKPPVQPQRLTNLLEEDIRQILRRLNHIPWLNDLAAVRGLPLDGPALRDRVLGLLIADVPPEPLTKEHQRVLRVTYLERPGTAVAISDRLAMSRSTYYRQLAEAHERLTAALSVADFTNSDALDDVMR